jgi:hypothetical protein
MERDEHKDTPHGAIYEIRVKGVLDSRWSEWFDGMTVSASNDETMLSGPVADQAALHGLLARVRDLGVPLLSVRQRDTNRVTVNPADGHHGTRGEQSSR